MAGRILEKSIAEVREKAKIEDIVGQYVTLRRSGSNMQGLCPFHDEKSPSFNVNPSRGFWHCFGCGEGGDVIAFVQKIDGLSFADTIERLADKVGVQLQREEGFGGPQEKRGPSRGTLIEAHRIAAEFFVEQLLSPTAMPARQFLMEKGFDQAAAARFGVGFAPTDGKLLAQHLRSRGFSEEELVTAGIVGTRGSSRFEGRVIWPIRESSGDVIGFGARKLFENDYIKGKYINTSETPIYKKNQVLYGIDLARKGLQTSHRAVIVEGYTDVMACHLAGVTTAVATCGTAFTGDHGKVLRRLMGDFAGSTGEIVFTFDGDAAGQAAAMKVFAADEDFHSPTYVAVAPDGMDPNDLRLRQGDEAVRALIDSRKPLYQFVLRNVVARYDLDRADGRVDALREGARLVSSVRDRSKVSEFTRELAGLVGVDTESAIAEVRRAGDRRTRPATSAAHPMPAAPPAGPALPDPRDPRLSLEREVLKVLLQQPVVIGSLTASIGTDDFTHPAYRALWALMAEAGGVVAGASDPQWVSTVRSRCTDERLLPLLSALAVESIRTKAADAGYVREVVSRLREATVSRSIADAHSRLQRSDPGDTDTYFRVAGELQALEQERRALRAEIAS
ncbi:DNA primase [Nocardioides sp. Kera G14]|uniref:DNA primase n=1 Tax=Nocardioides sp. Kera G14 TaxID=2884264 RepID=UPI001D129998|nr:DNA primase [Nocardioides sp. Kera G14]UDY24858.1 DNA primase [Nocardioides sp. Kera G14]